MIAGKNAISWLVGGLNLGAPLGLFFVKGKVVGTNISCRNGELLKAWDQTG